MRAFFKGWRRKAGCVTLLMSLMLIVGWMRSYCVLDRVEIDIGARRLKITSFHQKIYCFRVDGHGLGIQWGTKKFPRYEVGEQIARALDDTLAQSSSGCILPYWSLACPLTLLSAHLILWKPRKQEPFSPPQS